MVFEMAKEADFEAVNRLARQVVACHAQWDKSLDLSMEPYPKEWFLKFIQEDSLEQTTIYVARIDGDVVGFMRFYLWQTDSAVSGRRSILQLDDFGVEETLRNRSIGQQMMQELKELAQREGCAELRLNVDASNKRAIAFYERCGLHVRNHAMGLTF